MIQWMFWFQKSYKEVFTSLSRSISSSEMIVCILDMWLVSSFISLFNSAVKAIFKTESGFSQDLSIFFCRFERRFRTSESENTPTFELPWPLSGSESVNRNEKLGLTDCKTQEEATQNLSNYKMKPMIQH